MALKKFIFFRMFMFQWIRYSNVVICFLVEKLRVTSSNPLVANLNLPVTSSYPQVTRSNLRVTSSNQRVTSSNPRVRILKHELGD